MFSCKVLKFSLFYFFIIDRDIDAVSISLCRKIRYILKEVEILFVQFILFYFIFLENKLIEDWFGELFFCYRSMPQVTFMSKDRLGQVRYILKEVEISFMFPIVVIY